MMEVKPLTYPNGSGRFSGDVDMSVIGIMMKLYITVTVSHCC